MNMWKLVLKKEVDLPIQTVVLKALMTCFKLKKLKVNRFLLAIYVIGVFTKMLRSRSI